MKYILFTLLSLVIFSQPIFAQKVKIKKGVVSINKEPAFKIHILEKLEGTREKKIAYTSIGNDMDTVLIAQPRKVNYEKLPFEKSDKYFVYYEILNTKNKERGMAGQSFNIKKNLTKTLVKSKTLTTDSVEIANLKDIMSGMKVDPDIIEKVAAYNVIRKEMLADPITKKHVERLDSRHPNFEIKVNLTDGKITLGAGTQIGTIKRTSKPAPVAMLETFITYQVRSSNMDLNVATISFDAVAKRVSLIYFNQEQRPAYAYNIDKVIDDKEIEKLVIRLVDLGYL